MMSHGSKNKTRWAECHLLPQACRRQREHVNGSANLVDVGLFADRFLSVSEHEALIARAENVEAAESHAFANLVVCYAR